MWKKYFKFIKLVPGRVVTHQFGTIDFREDNIPLETIKSLYENDFPYLQLTKEGKAELYGTSAKIAEPRQAVKPVKVKNRRSTP